MKFLINYITSCIEYIASHSFDQKLILKDLESYVSIETEKVLQELLSFFDNKNLININCYLEETRDLEDIKIDGVYYLSCDFKDESLGFTSSMDIFYVCLPVTALADLRGNHHSLNNELIEAGKNFSGEVTREILINHYDSIHALATIEIMDELKILFLGLIKNLQDGLTNDEIFEIHFGGDFNDLSYETNLKEEPSLDDKNGAKQQNKLKP